MSWPAAWPVHGAQPPMPSANYAPPPLPAGPPPPPPNDGPTAPGQTSMTAASANNPYAYNAYQMTPEQQYYVQWQNYQQQYAQWQAMYGEQWNKEMVKSNAAPAPPPPNTMPTANQYAYAPYQQPPMAMAQPPPALTQKPPAPQVFPTSYNYDLTQKESSAAYSNNWEGNANDKRRPNHDVTATNSESFEHSNESANSEKSAEETAFDEQFRKWEEQFAEWKKKNANHPDREAYYEYENKMQEVRKKLLQRRADMRAKRIQSSSRVRNQNQPPNGAQEPQQTHVEATAQQSNEPVYPANAFQPIPGLDLLDNSENANRNKNNKRRQPKKRFDASPEDNESDSKRPRNLPFGFRDFFNRLRDDDPNVDNSNANENAINQSSSNDPQQAKQKQSRWNPQNQPNNADSDNNQRPNPWNEGQSPWANGQSPWQTNSTNNALPHASQPNAGKLGLIAGAIRSLMDIDVTMPLNNADNLNNFNNRFEKPNDGRPFNDPNPNTLPPKNSFAVNNETPFNNIRPFEDNSFRSNAPMDNSNINSNQSNNDSRSFNRSNQPNDDDSNLSGNNSHLNRDNEPMDNRRPFMNNSFNNRASFGNDSNFNDNSSMLPKRNVNIGNSGPMTDNNRSPLRYNDRFNDNLPGNKGRNDPMYRPPPAVHESTLVVPVKVTDYKHIPKRFQKLNISRVIDYSHMSRNRSPLPQRDSNRREQNDDIEDRNRSSRFQQDTGRRDDERRNPRQSRQRDRNERNQGNEGLSPVSDEDGSDKSKNKSAAKGKGLSRWNTVQQNKDSSEINKEKADPPTSLFPIGPAFLEEKDKEATQSTHKSLPVIRPIHQNQIKIDDILLLPGRATRPNKMVILLRGLPGSGKSHLAKLIKDKETDIGGSGKVRILSIDDYFSTADDHDEKKQVYKYDASMEETYMAALLKSFRTTITGGMFDIIVVDCNNTTLRYYTEFYNFATIYKFTPYTCVLDLDVEKCVKNNIHERTVEDIERAYKEWKETPPHYIHLDCSSLLKPPAEEPDKTEEISDDEDATIVGDNVDDTEAVIDNALPISADENSEEGTGDDDEDVPDTGMLTELGFLKSKWDTDTSSQKLARLDGTNKPIRHTIEDYLQLDGWEPPPTSSNGKKRVRWADIEERREQDKQRAIGFVVGQTNWDNILGTNDGSEALNKIKYI